MESLSSCPFCGKSVMIEAAKTGGWAILHDSIFADCVLHLPIVIVGAEKEYAIAKWNRRVNNG